MTLGKGVVDDEISDEAEETGCADAAVGGDETAAGGEDAADDDEGNTLEVVLKLGEGIKDDGGAGCDDVGNGGDNTIIPAPAPALPPPPLPLWYGGEGRG
ncbi:hypothetical protein FACS1894152_0490 [Bacilli bacterium]|nr:hypothetical protein FACS1894152_0310 [Bacilli bacterium]GHU26258.1 hypothetical protein FACS1894152_0490 [Bacilli bacterium]